MGFRVLRVSSGQFRVILASDAKPYDVFVAFLEVLSVILNPGANPGRTPQKAPRDEAGWGNPKQESLQGMLNPTCLHPTWGSEGTRGSSQARNNKASLKTLYMLESLCTLMTREKPETLQALASRQSLKAMPSNNNTTSRNPKALNP